MTTNNGAKEKGPVFEQKLGAIRVSVWRNSSDQGDWFNTVVTRRYRDNNDQWHDSNSFSGLSDLALLREALDLARDFIKSAALSRTGTASTASTQSTNGDPLSELDF